jgi:hypothetical protein
MNINKRKITGIIFSFVCLGIFVFGLTTERGRGSPLLGFLFWATLICILWQFAIMLKKRN